MFRFYMLQYNLPFYHPPKKKLNSIDPERFAIQPKLKKKCCLPVPCIFFKGSETECFLSKPRCLKSEIGIHPVVGPVIKGVTFGSSYDRKPKRHLHDFCRDIPQTKKHRFLASSLIPPKQWPIPTWGLLVSTKLPSTCPHMIPHVTGFAILTWKQP